MSRSDQKIRVMVVDDEEAILFGLKKALASYQITQFTDAVPALDALKSGKEFDVLIIDYRLPSFSGLDILALAKKHLKRYRAILLTAYADKEILEQAINKELIYKMINKPCSMTEIRSVVQDAVTDLESAISKEQAIIELEKDAKKAGELNEQLQALISAERVAVGSGHLVYKSKKMQSLVASAKKIASSNAHVLITGENGAGKDVFASIIHQQSRRAQNPFVKINCANLQEALFESELFGHERGAFTGAHSEKAGKFQIAHGGTLFLDEVGDMPLVVQPKLLRAIENKEITKVGGMKTIKTDVRILAATNKKLEHLVRAGRFREDLFHRLCILSLEVPPLRERIEDIPLLATYLLTNVTIEEGGIKKEFEEEAIKHLMTLEFSGNVRELKNIIHRAYLMSEEPAISIKHIKSAIIGYGTEIQDIMNQTMPLREFEGKIVKMYLQKEFAKHDNSLTKTANALGIHKGNLSRKMKELGVHLREQAKEESPEYYFSEHQ